MQSALEEARRAEWALERRMAAEARESQRCAAERAEQERLERIDAARRARQDAEDRRKMWTMGQARAMVRQGYSIEHTSRITGWSPADLEGADRIFETPDERPVGLSR